MEAERDASRGVLGLRDASDGGEEGDGEDLEVEGGEGDAVRFDVDE